MFPAFQYKRYLSLMIAVITTFSLLAIYLNLPSAASSQFSNLADIYAIDHNHLTSNPLLTTSHLLNPSSDSESDSNFSHDPVKNDDNLRHNRKVHNALTYGPCTCLYPGIWCPDGPNLSYGTKGYCPDTNNEYVCSRREELAVAKRCQEDEYCSFGPSRVEDFGCVKS